MLANLNGASGSSGGATTTSANTSAGGATTTAGTGSSGGATQVSSSGGGACELPAGTHALRTEVSTGNVILETDGGEIMVAPAPTIMTAVLEDAQPGNDAYPTVQLQTGAVIDAGAAPETAQQQQQQEQQYPDIGPLASTGELCNDFSRLHRMCAVWGVDTIYQCGTATVKTGVWK